MSKSINENSSKIRLQISFDPSDYESLAIAAKKNNRSIAGQARQWIQDRLQQVAFEARKESFYKGKDGKV